MLVVFWFSYNSLIIICTPLCMIFNKIINNNTKRSNNYLTSMTIPFYKLLISGFLTHTSISQIV